MMTASEAKDRAGSPARAAALSKRYAKLGHKAVDEQEFSKAYEFLHNASMFAAVLACVQGDFNRMAKQLGEPTRPFTKCSSCKVRKPDTKKRLDPYRHDVDNKKVYRNLCDDCHKQVQEGI